MQGAPALFILRFDPDPRSATALRRQSLIGRAVFPLPACAMV
jgi:hypothetical protein